jgi:hypothetical protein
MALASDPLGFHSEDLPPDLLRIAKPNSSRPAGSLRAKAPSLEVAHQHLEVKREFFIDLLLTLPAREQ